MGVASGAVVGVVKKVGGEAVRRVGLVVALVKVAVVGEVAWGWLWVVEMEKGKVVWEVGAVAWLPVGWGWEDWGLQVCVSRSRR
jgi:hypothetical protein